MKCFIVIFSIFLLSSYLQATTIAYYRFETENSTTVIDTVGSANGILSGATLTYRNDVIEGIVPQTGESNNRSLEITGNHVTFNSPFLLHQNTDATLEFAVRFTGSLNSHRSLFWSRSISSPDNNRFNIFTEANGDLFFDYREPNGTLHSAGGVNIANDEWTYVAMTRVIDSPTQHTYSIFVNGVLGSTVIDNNPNLPTESVWALGTGSCCPQFTGFVDEIRFSDEALSPGQFLSSPSLIPEFSNVVLLFLGLGGVAVRSFIQK